MAKTVKKAKTKRVRKAKTPRKSNRIAIVLDRSSSMTGIRAEAISAFNQQVAAIKAGSKDMDTTVSLYTFSTFADVPVILNQPVETLQPISNDNYLPDGMTAMYDSVGMAVTALKSLPDANDPDTSFLVVIISDGAENNSKNFTSAAITELVKSLQATGRWTFTYLGANQDLTQVSQSLNIPLANTMAFAANSAGAAKAGALNSHATSNYMMARSVGKKSVTAFYSPDQQPADQSQPVVTGVTTTSTTDNKSNK